MSKEISDEHIRIAAYYIWVAEGFPEGMAEVHWECARAKLAPLAAELASPDEAAAIQEEAAVNTDPATQPSTELEAEPAPPRPAARKTAKPVA